MPQTDPRNDRESQCYKVDQYTKQQFSTFIFRILIPFQWIVAAHNQSFV